MKDALGHGSAAHQAGVQAVGLMRNFAEGRDIYARLMAHAQNINPAEHSGWSHQDVGGFIHG